MPKYQPLDAAFNAGELSPRLAARLDYKNYPAGLEECQNLIPMLEGGLYRRPGSRFAWELKSSSVKGRLQKFQFTDEQAYPLEFGDHILRFGRLQGQITIPTTDGAITNGDFTADATTWDDVSTGSGSIAYNATLAALNLLPGGTGGTDIGWAEQDVAITTASGTPHALKFRVLGVPGDQIEVQIGSATGTADVLAATKRSTGYHVVSFSPTVSTLYIQFRNLGSIANKTIAVGDISLLSNQGLELDTPWPEAALFQVDGPQSADVRYLFHDDYPTHKLERYGHTTWSLTQVNWEDGPWLDVNETATTLTPAATTGLGINLTLSAVTGVNDDQGWLATDVGRLVRYTDSTDWGYAIITSITSTTVAVADVRVDLPAITGETTFHLGAWSGTTGYPSCSTFFEQRLYAASTANQPQTLWASQTGDFENFTPDNRDTTNDSTVEEDDALDYTLSADDVSPIIWLSAGENVLAIGTSTGEWVPSAEGAVITPLDIVVRRQTTHGCADIQPVRVGNVVLFVQRAGRRIREFGFSFESDGYKAPDMVRLAQHITQGGLVELAYQEEPDGLVWAVRGDGTLLSMTYHREEGVVGWARHVLGGSFSGGQAVVESIVTLPGTNGSGQTQDSTDRDEVWMIVKRTINGQTKRYVEFLEGYFEPGDAQEDAYYVDSCITYDGTAATALTGLSHLEAETVGVWGDGAIRDDEVVASGGVTLNEEASVAQVGLRFTHRAKPLRIIGGNPLGTPLGKHQRIYSLTFVLLHSHTLTFGPSDSDLSSTDFRVVSDPMDAAAPLFTGQQRLQFSGPWTRDARILIVSDDPAPFVLLAMAPEIIENPAT